MADHQLFISEALTGQASVNPWDKRDVGVEVPKGRGVDYGPPVRGKLVQVRAVVVLAAVLKHGEAARLGQVPPLDGHVAPPALKCLALQLLVVFVPLEREQEQVLDRPGALELGDRQRDGLFGHTELLPVVDDDIAAEDPLPRFDY